MVSRPQMPPPVIEVAVAPRCPTDRPRLERALSIVAARDPSLTIDETAKAGPATLRGSSDLHLGRVLDDLRGEFQLLLLVGKPRIVYRETIAGAAVAVHNHKEHRVGPGDFAEVTLALEPNSLGRGNTFEHKIVDRASPPEFLHAIRKGIDAALRSGVLFDCPVTDVAVTCLDGNYYQLNAALPCLEIAAEAAVRDALVKGGPVLLEPVMRIEIVTSPDYQAPILEDLQTRDVDIMTQSTAAGQAVIQALAPLAEILGFAEDLRSVSQRTAAHSIEFDHYAPLSSPANPKLRPMAAARA